MSILGCENHLEIMKILRLDIVTSRAQTGFWESSSHSSRKVASHCRHRFCWKSMVSVLETLLCAGVRVCQRGVVSACSDVDFFFIVLCPLPLPNSRAITLCKHRWSTTLSFDRRAVPSTLQMRNACRIQAGKPRDSILQSPIVHRACLVHLVLVQQPLVLPYADTAHLIAHLLCAVYFVPASWRVFSIAASAVRASLVWCA